MPKPKSPFNFKQIPALYNSVSFKDGTSEHDARGFPDLLSILRKEKGGFKAVASEELLIAKPIVWQIHILSLSTIRYEMDYYINLACLACDDGFTLLLPIHDRLEECTSSEEFLAKLKYIVPMHESNLIDRLAQKNLGRNEVTILNYLKGKWLLNEIARRTILFPHANKDQEENFNHLEVSLENLIPFVENKGLQEKILFASYPKKLNEDQGVIISLIPESQLLAQNHSIDEPVKYFPEQLSIEFSTNKGDYFLLSRLSQITELITSIQMAADIDYLKNQAINTLPNLESLRLTLETDNDNNDDELIDLTKLSSFANRLRSVKLTGFSEENKISTFLNSLDKLEELETSDLTFISKNPACLRKLKRLHITNASETIYNLELEVLFSLAPDLEILEIDNFEFTADSISKYQPKKLTTLIFNNCKFKENLLFTTLQSTDTIREISLIETEIYDSPIEINWDAITLNLQKIKIIRANISARILAPLILNSLQLEALTIQEFFSFTEIFSSSFQPLYNLITLELIDNGMKEINPLLILPQTNSPLRHLRLDGTFPFDETHQPPSLPNLETCKFNGNNIRYLASFLKDSHKLLSLTLNLYDALDKITSFPSLPQLSILKFIGASISEDIAKIIFQQASNIKHCAILIENIDKSDIYFERAYIPAFVDDLGYFILPSFPNAFPFEKILTILMKPARSLGLHKIKISLDDIINVSALSERNRNLYFLTLDKPEITLEKLEIILSLLPNLKILNIRLEAYDDVANQEKLLKESDLEEILKKFPHLIVHSEESVLNKPELSNSQSSMVTNNQFLQLLYESISSAVNHNPEDDERNTNDFLSGSNWQKTKSTLKLSSNTSSADTEYVISDKKLMTFSDEADPASFRRDCFIINRITQEPESINPNTNMQARNTLQRINFSNTETTDIFISTHSPDKNNKIISPQCHFEEMKQGYFYVLPQQGINNNFLKIISSTPVALEVYYLPFFNFHYVIPRKNITTPVTLTYSMEHIENEFIMPKEFDRFHLSNYKTLPAFFDFMRNSAPHIDISDFLIKDQKNHFLYTEINITPYEQDGILFFHFNEQGKLFIKSQFSKLLLSLSEREKIAHLALFLRSFTDNSLDGEYHDKYSLFNAMLRQKKGVCSHLSHLFIYLAHGLGIYSQIIDNPIHNYIEVRQGSTLLTLDLGGGDRYKFKRNNNNKPHALLKNTITKNSSDENFTNALFVFNDPMEIENLNSMMFEKLKKSYYYLHSMDEIFHEQLIAEETGAYRFSESALVSFLKQDNGILAINLSDASKEQLLECLNLINRQKFHQQQFIGIDCAKTLRVIFIVAKNNPHIVPHNKMEQIFYGNQIVAPSPMFNAAAMQLDNIHSINLYENSASWESLLLGWYIMDGTKNDDVKTQDTERKATEAENSQAPSTKILFVPGALINALDKKASGIRIVNPAHDKKLHRFLNEISHKKCFIFNGIEYIIPDNFTIETEKEPYTLNNTFSFSQQPITSLLTENTLCLNSTTFPNFFHTYRCENQQLFIKSGWLKMAKDGALVVAITEILPISLFAQFLNEAIIHNVKIHFIISPELSVPMEFATAAQSKTPDNVAEVSPPITVQIIQSNDIDFSTELLEKHYLNSEESDANNTEILYVSNESYADLISTFEATGIKEQTPRFSITAGCVAEWLYAGKTIILYGKFSSDFIKQISTLLTAQPYLWVNGKKLSITGKLFLISEQSPQLPDCPKHNQQFSTKDFFNYLNTVYPTNIDLIANLHKAINKLAEKDVLFSFIQIKTMLKMLQLKPYINPLRVFLHTHSQRENLLAMTDDYFIPEVQPKKIKVSSNVEFEDDITVARLSEIKDVFAYSPFAILDGSTGTGKSAIIAYFSKEYDVIFGEENIEKFFSKPKENVTAPINPEMASSNAKTSSTPKRKKRLLFIDEMNIADPNTWNFLKNLCSNNPRVLYRSKIYLLTAEDNIDGEEDKIILAGNFNKKYGNNRHQQTLVSQYGAIVEFKPFPASFLARKIIRPYLNSMELPQLEQEILTDIFLQSYLLANNKLARLGSYIAVSPRNLEMMLHRWSWLCQQMPTMAMLEVAKIAAYREIKTLFDDKVVRRELKQATLIDPLALQQWTAFKKETVSAITDGTFVLTPTHISPNAKNFIITSSRTSPLYKLHELMSLREKIMRNPHNKSHLHGLLYEGEASSGKLFLLRAYLESNNIPHEIIKPHNAKQQLIDLFHKGHAAIIPRIGMLGIERTLNLLMMGVDPQGKPAENSGFVVLATQLDKNQSGTLSPAVFNRFEREKTKPYSDAELIDILVKNIGFDIATATSRVLEFRSDMQENTGDLVTQDRLFKITF